MDGTEAGFLRSFGVIRSSSLWAISFFTRVNSEGTFITGFWFVWRRVLELDLVAFTLVTS
jgi:hypothetical protein